MIEKDLFTGNVIGGAIEVHRVADGIDRFNL